MFLNTDNNISIIGRSQAMPSTISCEEAGNKMTFLKYSQFQDTNCVGNELWKDFLTSFKSHSL